MIRRTARIYMQCIDDTTHSSAFSSSSNRIFRAVPMPDTCSFPHSLHLSHPTQSMIRETLRKCVLNCSLSTCNVSFGPLITRATTHNSIGTGKERLLVKTSCNPSPFRHPQHLAQSLLRLLVPGPFQLKSRIEACLYGSSRHWRRSGDVVSLQIWSCPRYGTEKENGVKVHVG